MGSPDQFKRIFYLNYALKFNNALLLLKS